MRLVNQSNRLMGILFSAFGESLDDVQRGCAEPHDVTRVQLDKRRHQVRLP